MLVMRLMGIHMPLSSIAWNIIEMSGSTEWRMGYMYTHVFAGFITRTSSYLRMHNVDNTQNIISFCTGYSGLELGIKRAGVDVRTICYLEIEVYVQAVLVKAIQEGRLCPAPIWTNVKSFDARPFRGVVDGITGGFPCQPFSSAGKRKGQEDPRHLWPSIANAIRLCRPGWVFLENVPGLVTLGLRDVLQDLGQMGYRTTWGIFSASEVGAPHQRKRVFILAHRNNTGLERYRRHVSVNDSQGREEPTRFAWPSRPGFEQFGWEPPRVVGNSNSIDRSASTEGRQHDAEAGRAGKAMGNANCTGFQERTREPSEGIQRADSDGGAHQSWQAQPTLGGDAHGPAGGLGYAELCISSDNRTDELRMLGNGVVPATAERAFRVLLKEIGL